MKMQIRWLSVVCTTLALVAPARAETRVTSTDVVDVSEAGSPLRISGSVRLKETTWDGTVRLSHSEEIVAQNISNKTIMTLVVWLDIIPSFTGPKRAVRQYECFFAPDVIRPGDTHPLSLENSREDVEPYNSAEPPRTASATVRVAYVQFADGSVFGNEAFGADIQRIRKTAWQHLRRLDRTYIRSGEKAFADELNEPIEPAEVNTLIENVRQTQRTSGTIAAVSHLRKMLRLAEEHQIAFTARDSH